MNDHVLVLGTFILLFIILAGVVVALLNYRLRKRIIESGPLDDMGVKFLGKLSSSGSETLKWGLILFSGGLGLIVIYFLPTVKTPYSLAAETPPSLAFGVEAIFIAAGFLAYYFIERKNKQ